MTERNDMSDYIEMLIQEVGDHFGDPKFLGEFTRPDIERFSELYAAARNQRDRENKAAGKA